jgi:putative membrane protein
MPLLKLLHFAALIGWCGALLYLPALIYASRLRSEAWDHHQRAPVARLVFTLLATPAALLTIGSGTALFVRDAILGNWLFAKLTAVTAMVLLHALCGVLLLRVERQPQHSPRLLCLSLGVVLAILIAGTLWLVLAKPF